MFGSGLYAWNYLAVGAKMRSALDSDPRNSAIEANAHFALYFDPTSIIFDVRAADGASCLDMLRVTFQFAANMRGSSYAKVFLQKDGVTRFVLKGDYFQTLGDEYYRGENPLYLTRTFSENVQFPNGQAAFATWDGGWLGVMSKQIEDANSFCMQWLR